MRYLALAQNYVIVFLVALAVGVWTLAWVSSPMGGSNEPVLVSIPRGLTATGVGQRIKEKGLIRSARFFALTARVSGKSAALKPGLYELNRGMSLLQIIRKLEQGEFAAVWITIPEGFTARQIARRLAARGLVSEESFMQAAYEGHAFPEVSAGADGSLEGFLFPDTYLIPLQADARFVVRRMVAAFQEKIGRPYAEQIRASELCRLVPGQTCLRSVVILASLIEREARKPEDRTKISGVIYNRLRRGMKLDIDATVQYARGEHKARLLYSDLAVDSPYNTYRHAGLPPGPIANPGKAAIEAALHPADTDALYYVARRDGRHIFSSTLEDHNAAKQRIKAGY